MVWKAKQNGQAVKGIVALLLSLAVLADCIAFMPSPVRRFVLTILRRAERIGYSYVYWTARDCGAPLHWLGPTSFKENSDPADAIELAHWLRVLALALRDLPRQALLVKGRARFRNRSIGSSNASGHAAPAFRVPAPDMS